MGEPFKAGVSKCLFPYSMLGRPLLMGSRKGSAVVCSPNGSQKGLAVAHTPRYR